MLLPYLRVLSAPSCWQSIWSKLLVQLVCWCSVLACHQDGQWGTSAPVQTMQYTHTHTHTDCTWSTSIPAQSWPESRARKGNCLGPENDPLMSVVWRRVRYYGGNYAWLWSDLATAQWCYETLVCHYPTLHLISVSNTLAISLAPPALTHHTHTHTHTLTTYLHINVTRVGACSHSNRTNHLKTLYTKAILCTCI